MSSTLVQSPSSTSVPARVKGRTRGAYRGIHWLVFLVLMAAFSWVYVDQGSRATVHVRPRNFSALEARHLTVAEETVKDFHPDFSHSFSEPLKRLLPHRTDGVVQPLWPWIAAWLLDSGGVDTWVQHANWMQLGWTLGWALLLGFICARSFTAPAAVLVVLLVGLEGFLPTVGPFTSAALFQVLFLLTWVACIFALQRNSLWVYGFVGGLGALAYLAEDRVLPLLIVFVLVSTVRASWEWLVAHFPREAGTTLWVPRNHGLGLLLMAAVFFFTIGPRLAESHERFGGAFFTYQDQVRWLDDAQAAQAWMYQHPDSGRIATKNPLELFQSYRQEHSREAMTTRFGTGLKAVWRDFTRHGGSGLGLALGLLGLMALAMKWATPQAMHAGQRLHPESVPALIFMLMAAGAYILIAAWDEPISGAQGRLLLLQAPLALAILWGCESLLRRARRRKASPIFFRSYHVLMWALVGIESWRVIEGLRGPLSAP